MDISHLRSFKDKRDLALTAFDRMLDILATRQTSGLDDEEDIIHLKPSELGVPFGMALYVEDDCAIGGRFTVFPATKDYTTHPVAAVAVKSLTGAHSGITDNPWSKYVAVHEITHAIDYLIRKDDMGLSNGVPITASAIVLSDYMNSSHEFNAFYQQSMAMMEHHFGGFGSLAGRSPEQKVRTLLDAVFPSSFINHLTPKNKRRVVRRIYKEITAS